MGLKASAIVAHAWNVMANGMYAVSRFSPRYIVEVKMQLQPFRLHARLRTAAGNL